MATFLEIAMPRSRVLVLCSVLAGVLPLPAARAAEQHLTVTIDHAQITRLPSGTATIVVGNPLVADGTVQANGVLVITGRSYGSTNVLALDNGGATLADIAVTVRAGSSNIVTLYRGTGRETLACSPNCEPTLRIGDSPEAFQALSDEIGKRNGLSTQAN